MPVEKYRLGDREFVKIWHHAAYGAPGERDIAYAERTADGGIDLSEVVYEGITLTREHLLALGFVPARAVPSYRPNARDDAEAVLVPRSLLRAVVADLELLRGLVRGQAAVDPRVLAIPAHENGANLGERIEACGHLVNAVMAAGGITEDEDLDD